MNTTKLYFPIGWVGQPLNPNEWLILTDNGWLYMDGAQLRKEQFPKLFLAIGYTYGGEGGSFNIPKLHENILVPVDNR